MGDSPWGHKESDTTEQLHFNTNNEASQPYQTPKPAVSNLFTHHPKLVPWNPTAHYANAPWANAALRRISVVTQCAPAMKEPGPFWSSPALTSPGSASQLYPSQPRDLEKIPRALLSCPSTKKSITTSSSGCCQNKLSQKQNKHKGSHVVSAHIM